MKEKEEEHIEKKEKASKKKVKKAPPRRRKSKKEKESDVVKAIRLVVESGKISFGYNTSLKSIQEGTPKMIIISNNIPEIHLNEINHFSELKKVPVYRFDGNAKELAAVCGKPFLVSVLSIFDEGASNILKLIMK